MVKSTHLRLNSKKHMWNVALVSCNLQKMVAHMDAESSKHIALTILGDKMLTCTMEIHILSDMRFGSEMSSDGLKVLALSLLTGQVELLTMIDCQMACNECKKQPWFWVLMSCVMQMLVITLVKFMQIEDKLNFNKHVMFDDRVLQ